MFLSILRSSVPACKLHWLHLRKGGYKERIFWFTLFWGFLVTNKWTWLFIFDFLYCSFLLFLLRLERLGLNRFGNKSKLVAILPFFAFFFFQ